MYVAPAPTSAQLFDEVERERFMVVAQHLSSLGRGGEYLHWDKLRHLDPPHDLTNKEWWLGIKMTRAPLLRQLPLTDPDGTPFSYSVPDEALRLLHYLDQRCSGEIAMPEAVTADEQARQHYLVNSLMEEAIRSSQLEGAATSRRVAKELLTSGRPPKDRSERMIVNNYQALQFIRDGIGDALRPAHVLELQRILTEGTLDNPDAAGRLQRPDEERVAVYDRVDGELIHRPPPAEQLPDRLEAMCAFANANGEGEAFLHPVLRALLIHFWLAYDHPFEDGNGRTARALFYWSMQKHGYWLTEYLSISRILRQGPARYSRAFLLTERDEGDTTYFIIFQLKVIKRAVEELHKYLARKVKEVREVERAVRDHFNHRQLALISDAVRNPGRSYTYRSHAGRHNVTEETARTDLLALAKAGLFDRRRSGRKHIYEAKDDLASRLTR